MSTSMSKFISVEGIDGVGKSTVCQFIKDYIEKQTKNQCTIVRQNRTEPVGKMIRNFITNNPEAKHVSDKVYSFLFLAGIVETVENIIQPTLDKGEWVVTDRYTMSTAVYQNSIMTDLLLDDFSRWFASPKYIFVLDAPPNVIKSRIETRNENTDIFEQVSPELINRRRKLFLDLAYTTNSEVIIIDTSKPLEVVLSNVQNHLDNIIHKTLSKTNR